MGFLLCVPLRWNLPKDQIGGDWIRLLRLEDRDQNCRGRGGYDQTRMYFIGVEDSVAPEQGHGGLAWILPQPYSGTARNRCLLLLSLDQGVTLDQTVSSLMMFP